MCSRLRWTLNHFADAIAIEDSPRFLAKLNAIYNNLEDKSLIFLYFKLRL